MSHQPPPDSGIGWLGFKPWRAEQEGDHFFIGGRACIHCTMHAGIWLVPIDHARVQGNLHLFPCLAELPGELNGLLDHPRYLHRLLNLGGELCKQRAENENNRKPDLPQWAPQLG